MFKKRISMLLVALILPFGMISTPSASTVDSPTIEEPPQDTIETPDETAEIGNEIAETKEVPTATEETTEAIVPEEPTTETEQEDTILEPDTTTEKNETESSPTSPPSQKTDETKSPTNNLQASKPDTDIVNASDFDNQQWLINEIARQIPTKTIGSTLTFGDLRQITNINLTAVNGSIPPGIEYLSELSILSLRGYGLTGSLPTSIGSLGKLKVLDIGETSLSGSLPASLGNLSSLTTLSVYDNLITGPIPKELANATSLQSIYLVESQLSGELPKELATLPQLKSINLAFNEISGTVPAEFASAPALEDLYVNSNKLTGIIPDVITQSTLSFKFSNNQISANNAASLTLTNAIGSARYTNTFVTNLQLASKTTIPTTTHSTVIKPFDSTSNTYFDLHYLNQSTRGTLQSAHTYKIINQDTQEVMYNGPANKDVSFTQSESADYLVIMDDAVGNSHNTTNISIQTSILELGNMPDSINFGTHKITSTTQLYKPTEDWSIQVNDTRATKTPWRLSVATPSKMQSSSGHTLSEGLIYKAENGTETTLSNQYLDVYQYTPNSTDTQVNITWPENAGIFLKVKAGEGYAESYSGELDWTLTDAP
ncbi:hypothetical protein HCB69_05610 [Listeria booriae]|uniref:WxL domain-containing protein n=1 Tax=Listeria booriae TaxID=1552123 RepID=A0A842G0Q0_9LIST|nr:WxL domain-containing protein [Listeria booriae]MBC2283847.1 hypothetical protein [Listeria booriae]MBC2291653.1 hypothetical protein [Listeria booriae]